MRSSSVLSLSYHSRRHKRANLFPTQLVMGAAVVAIIIKKEKDLVAYMRAQNALSPATARSLNDLQVNDKRTLGRLRTEGVIREASPGVYYLDEEIWLVRDSKRRKRALIVIAVLAVIFIVLVVPILLMNYSGSGNPVPLRPE